MTTPGAATTLNLPVRTDYHSCYQELVERGGPKVKAKVQHWEQNRDEAVVAFVQGFTHEHLYQLTLAQVKEVCQTTQHALGNIKKIESLCEVEDFTCPFAMHHLFHDCLERLGRLPKWEEFWAWMHEPYASTRFIVPIRKSFEWDSADARRKAQLDRAFQWRVGKFYYSALREVHTITYLREKHGLPLKYHLLADVLLRTDFWHEDTLIGLYLNNSQFRDEAGGRKERMEDIFADARPKFRFYRSTMDDQKIYGKVYLFKKSSLDKMASDLK